MVCPQAKQPMCQLISSTFPPMVENAEQISVNPAGIADDGDNVVNRGGGRQTELSESAQRRGEPRRPSPVSLVQAPTREVTPSPWM